MATLGEKKKTSDQISQSIISIHIHRKMHASGLVM